MLFENAEADTVAITADHGDAFGEYGIDHHSAGSLHPKIRWEPWVVTSATDTGSHTPDFDPEESGELSRESMLRDLDYLK